MAPHRIDPCMRFSAHGSPTFFTASIQRARCRGRKARGGTTIPLRSISPRRSGDWRATTHASEVLLGGGVVLRAGDRDDVQCVVELPVAAAVESVLGAFA